MVKGVLRVYYALIGSVQVSPYDTVHPNAPGGCGYTRQPVIKELMTADRKLVAHSIPPASKLPHFIDAGYSSCNLYPKSLDY